MLPALTVMIETGLGELVYAERIAFLELCERPVELEETGFIRLDELDKYVAWRSRRTDA